MVTCVILDDLEGRGLIHDTTDERELRLLLAGSPVVLYHGIDPSASSLHVGHLVGVLVLRRFQDQGHRPLVLLGGATGMIGDPSGRSGERNLLDADTLASNEAGIRGQLERLLDFGGQSGARMVNNYDWTRDISILDFLRDVGKYVTVNRMVAKDSVRERLNSDRGISYTEFSYMLLQAFDYWVQHVRYDCRLQIGGSDQWGNITAGIDLVRRRAAASVHGLTWPLITRSDGQKFGKSVDGAVWLDPERTSPYALHQYFLRCDDRDVERFLRQLTLLPIDEVTETMSGHRRAPEARMAQRRLADAVTELIHGPLEVQRANLAASVLFGSGAHIGGGTAKPVELNAETFDALRGIVPETQVSRGSVDGDEAIVDLLVLCGLCSSKGDARRTIAGGGVRVNGARVESAGDAMAFIGGRYLLIRRGRTNHRLLVVRD